MRIKVHNVVFQGVNGDRYESLQVTAPVDSPLYAVAEDRVVELEADPGCSVELRAGGIVVRHGERMYRLRQALELGLLTVVQSHAEANLWAS